MMSSNNYALHMGAAAAILCTATQAAQARDCPAPPPPAVDIALERYYADDAGSVVDSGQFETHKAQVAPLALFTGFVAKQADRAWQQRASPTATIACALSWLRIWAQASAYLGTMASKQAQAQSRWDLAGAALAYVKLRKWASAQDRAIIEPWFAKWADRAQASFDSAGAKHNNHWYWLGLAQMAVALATDNAERLKSARAIFQEALSAIAADGTLPLELERAGRALHYHAFALEPLVMMAEIAATRGEDWYALNGGALHRLVARTAEGLKDPAIFDRLTGTPQQRPVTTGYGWASLYRDRFFNLIPERIEQPPGHRRVGGDVYVLMRALAR